MNDNTKHNEIRNLLDRYYAGESTRDEQSRLALLLREGVNLPEDLEEERRIFQAMECQPVEADMPADLQKRIDSAMESEFRSARRGRVRRLSIFAAGSAAACALLIWTVTAMVSGEGRKEASGLAEGKKPDVERSEARGDAEVNEKTEVKENQTLQTLALAEPTSKPERKGEKSNRGSSVAPVVPGSPMGEERCMSIDPPKNPPAESASQHEVSAGTRIVTDEREATRMVEEANARFESSMRRVDCRIREMNERFETLLTRVNTINAANVNTMEI